MVVREKTLQIADAVKTKVLESSPVRKLLRGNLANALRSRGLELGYLIVIFALTAGFVNTILEGVKPQYSGMIYVPGRGVQTVNEAVINFFNLVLGTAGIYMIYAAAKSSSRRRLSGLYMVVGFGAVIIAILVGMYLLWLKKF